MIRNGIGLARGIDPRWIAGCVVGVLVSASVWAQAQGQEAVADPHRGVVVMQADAGPAEKVEVPSEILVLHATNTGGGIDPELRNLKQLQKPPFSAYDTYRLLHRHSIVLKPQQPDSTQLPNGRTLRTVLKAVLPEDRFRVAASISRPPREKDKEGGYLPLLEVTAKSGEPFFVAGQSFRGGILVVGIQVGKEVPKEKPPAGK
jgi:hypothetical protein